jgi:hypothetical protein
MASSPIVVHLVGRVEQSINVWISICGYCDASMQDQCQLTQFSQPFHEDPPKLRWGSINSSRTTILGINPDRKCEPS